MSHSKQSKSIVWPTGTVSDKRQTQLVSQEDSSDKMQALLQWSLGDAQAFP